MQFCNRIRGLAIVIVCALALVLNAALATATPALPGAIDTETFEVGENVYVRALAIDEARGSIWVGTSVGALEIDLASREPKQVFTRENGLANEYVFAIGVSPGGEVWFGTNGGGTSRWKDGEWTTFFPMHGLADYWVYAFEFDEQGRVWIGTWDGANLFEPSTGNWTTFHDELVNIWVYGLDIDPEGRVWLGTEGGVSMYDSGAWTSWTHDDGLGAKNAKALPPSENTGLGTRSRHDLSIYVDGQESYNPSYVFASMVDAVGRGIWFGTWGGGASLFDGDAGWTSYTEADGLSGNVVYSIAQQADGTVWLGTNDGVTAYDGTTFRGFDLGKAARHVYSLAIAPDGSIWAGTRGAVLRISAQE